MTIENITNIDKFKMAVIGLIQRYRQEGNEEEAINLTKKMEQIYGSNRRALEHHIQEDGNEGGES